MLTPQLNVPDVPRAVAWYTALGLRLLDADGAPATRALLALGEGRLLLASGGREGPVERRDVDLDLVVDDVEKLYYSLPKDVEVLEEISEGEFGLQRFVLRDPDGYWIVVRQEL